MRLKDFIIEGKKSDYEKIAENILKDFHFSHPSQLDIYDLCEHYGMRVSILESEDMHSHSIASGNGRKGIIFLERTNSIALERQILAEEFSHLYIHAKNQLFIDAHEINKMELQATKLAAHLLIPDKWLLNIQVFPEYNLMSILASDVANEFNVTPEFAYKRLKMLKESYTFHSEEPILYHALSMLTEAMLKRIVVILDQNNRFFLN